jgi:hypothetical protein
MQNPSADEWIMDSGILHSSYRPSSGGSTGGWGLQPLMT